MKKKISIAQIIKNMKIERAPFTIQVFHFNLIEVNTLVIYDATKEAIIVDPGNCNEVENEILQSYIEKEGLTVKYIVNTHPHIDHVVGNHFCTTTFQAPLLASKDGMVIYEHSPEYGLTFGFTQSIYPTPTQFLKEGEVLAFGNQKWEILECYGHADGSICLYNREGEVVIVGDVLFAESIGRTDLPTGNYEQLIQNIQQKLLTLPPQTLVIPGHAHTTTIEHEQNHNPYFR